MSDQHSNVPSFSALHSGEITLRLINDEQLPMLLDVVAQSEEAEDLAFELRKSYAPQYDEDGRRTRWGFYAMIAEEIVGFSLLSVDSWTDRRGSTGADTLPRHRGKGVAPGSKPHLFYLGFHILGLNRIETGCLVSNVASRRSLEKTRGFVFEGILREYEWNPDTNRCEDVLYYSILRREWEPLYKEVPVELIP